MKKIKNKINALVHRKPVICEMLSMQCQEGPSAAGLTAYELLLRRKQTRDSLGGSRFRLSVKVTKINKIRDCSIFTLKESHK